MKKVKSRTWFTLALTAALAAGMILFVVRYITKGASWAGFSGNQAETVYSDGDLTQGAIYDRNGTLLYDAERDTYSDDWSTRVATLHAVGDREGMIATSALSKFSGLLSGYNAVTGVTSGGSDLSLTIDAEANVTAYNALAGYKGTIGVYNYKTGEILCMVSTPTYDPENVPTISDDDDNYTGVYVNRFYSSTFTPGSVFKIVTLAAAIENIDDLFTRTFQCNALLSLGGGDITCPSVHGSQNIKDAFAHSCNVTFGTLADELGADTMEAYADQAGLTSSHSVDGIRTAAGYYENTDNEYLLAWSGIGQSEDLVNPCAMMRLMGAIANGGTPVEPRIILSQTSIEYGIPVAVYTSTNGSRIWSEETCDTITEFMRNNVQVTYGQAQFGDLPVCAKSGTAETNEAKPTSWFVGFVDSDEYPYAFACAVENSGSGASVAGSVVAATLLALEANGD